MRSAVRWGNSEYSEEAESLFADHLARQGGIGEEFEELCSAHPELADELEGLRADWENVAGIVERLREAELAPAPPGPPEDASATAAALAPRRLSGAKWSMLALPVLGLVCLLVLALRARESMAAERGAALTSAEALRFELDRARDRLGSLEEERAELESQNLELARAREASELSAGRAAALAEALWTLQRLRELRDAAERLWPALPERAPELEAWIAKAEELGVEQERSAQAPWPATGGETGDGLAEVRRLVQAELSLLGGPSGLWSVMRTRLALARDPLLGGHPWVLAAWEGAGSAIESRLAHPGYAGLELRPQAGLLPLASGSDELLSFLHLPTYVGVIDESPGDLAARALEEGLVLRLLPGGAQPPPPAEPSEAREESGPGEGGEDPIAPFFLSKDPLPAWLLRRLCESGPGRSAVDLVDLEALLQPLGLAIATPAELGWARTLGAIPLQGRQAGAPELYLRRALDP